MQFRSNYLATSLETFYILFSFLRLNVYPYDTLSHPRWFKKYSKTLAFSIASSTITHLPSSYAVQVMSSMSIGRQSEFGPASPPRPFGLSAFSVLVVKVLILQTQAVLFRAVVVLRLHQNSSSAIWDRHNWSLSASSSIGPT